MDENPSPAVGYIHYSDGHAEFTFNSTETRASGTEMKSRDEADEVLGIEHLRFSFHQIIKELLTCQIPRGHRLRPPGTFPPGLWSIYPHIALNGSGCDAGVSTATSRLHGAYCLLIGLLLPPLLFSTEQPGCLLWNKSNAAFPLNSKASQPSYSTYRSSRALAPRSWLLRDGLGTSGDEGFPGVSEAHRLRVCPDLLNQGRHIHWSLRSSVLMVWPAVASLPSSPSALPSLLFCCQLGLCSHSIYHVPARLSDLPLTPCRCL